jgi:Holliday junction DNA helicase RuvA
MYEYIKGKIASANATQVVIDCGGVGYLLEVTLNTYAQLKDREEALLWVYEVVREDAFTLYGFAEKSEREMFELLIGVSGIGAGTARVMLSSMTVGELARAIVEGNAKAIQKIKGIGGKTAQRVTIELADKVVEYAGAGVSAGAAAPVAMTANKSDAQAALIMLGFPKPAVEKALGQLDNSLTVEELIKQAMQRM